MNNETRQSHNETHQSRNETRQLHNETHRSHNETRQSHNETCQSRLYLDSIFFLFIVQHILALIVGHHQVLLKIREEGTQIIITPIEIST
jgi:hypothetical protein